MSTIDSRMERAVEGEMSQMAAGTSVFQGEAVFVNLSPLTDGDSHGTVNQGRADYHRP